MPATETAPTWTPNQQAARTKIIGAAAELIAEQGLGACTIRAVADRSGLTKSTVHYYFDDSNELIDLSVNEIFQRMGRYARQGVADADDASGAVEFLVRLFMGRARTPPDLKFHESMLWPAYTAHAWKRGARHSILQGLEPLRGAFELALTRADVPSGDAAERANSVHNYLLGAMVRNMIEPMNRDEVARAVSALSGLPIDAGNC